MRRYDEPDATDPMEREEFVRDEATLELELESDAGMPTGDEGEDEQEDK